MAHESDTTIAPLVDALRAGAELRSIGVSVAFAAPRLPGRARDLAEKLAGRLADGIDPLVPPEAAVSILAAVLEELAAIEAGRPIDEDAIDVHRSALRALEPIDVGLGPPADPAAEAEEPPSPEVVRVFQQEARELLAVCEAALLELEAGPAEPQEPIDTIFRSLHSFKGNCGFMRYRTLEQLAHRAESLLVLLKEGRRAIDDRTVPALIYVIDALSAALHDATSADPPVPGLGALLESLDRLIEEPTRAEEAPPVSVHDDAPPTPPWPAAPPAPAPRLPPVAAPKPAPEVRAADDAPARPADEAPARGAEAARAAETTLRVDVAKGESRLDLVGELIIAQTAVRHLRVTGPDADVFGRATAQLDRVVRSLQDVSLSLRMVPVGPTFRKMTRVVRDVSHRVGKSVELELDGEDTEIDKSVADLVADPLVHLVRNAIDHGIEPADQRLAAGKPAAGRLRLSGSQVGGEVWIRVEDDGRGLDRDRIVARAVERGLVAADDAPGLSDGEVYAFVFAPGFSTADRVTDVSGRGVGLDVVSRNLERVKGRVEIRSSPGRGSAFTLRIPLTLAIIEGMLLRVGGDAFTVPLLNVRESVVCRPQDVTVLSSGQELVRIRGEQLPVLRLHRAFDLTPDQVELPKGILIVVEDGGQALAVFVDQLVGQRQTVIKAVPGFLGHVRGVAGCTVLGDGRICLVLDVGALVQRAAAAA